MSTPDASAAFTIGVYAILVVLWSTILVIYIRSRRRIAESDALVVSLLGVLALDALKSLLESTYFGLLWSSNYGALPASIGRFLSTPSALVAPKAFHVFVAVVVLAFLVRKWLPRAVEERSKLRASERTLAAELVKTVEALRREEERWQLTIEATAEVVWDFDVVRGTVFLGPGFERITGRPSTMDLAGLREIVDPQDYERVRSSLRRALEDPAERVWEYELRILHAEVGTRHVLARAVLQRDATGSATRLVGSIVDRTDDHQMAESRLAAQKLESVGLLAGGIAHDFNNLLTSILANTSLAKKELGSAESVRKHLEIVETASQQAAELTRQLLAYSGRGRIVVEPVAIDRIVRDIVRVLEVSVSRRATLTLELDGLDGIVDADVAQLQQVVMNLVTNAADAVTSTRGRIVVRSHVRAVDEAEARRSTHAVIEPGRYVVLEVTDDGRGMSDEVRERIFDPFFTTKATGRGLGLSAILGILRGHHAGLVVESKVGEGTTFRMYFPLGRSSQERVRLPLSVDDTPLAGSVLVVDDEESIRDAASALLRALGLEVVAVEHGLAAIAVLEASDRVFDLVLLDLTMPRLDGHATLERLRSHSPTLPIVLSSGYSAQEVLASYANDGRTTFLPKPWRAAELVDAVRFALAAAHVDHRPREMSALP
jgi:signal transduction histidine kinase/CheY-like chemotaxis protein